jgi:hypothetical protein
LTLLRAVLMAGALALIAFAGPSAQAAANASKLFANGSPGFGVETSVFTVGDIIYSNGAIDSNRFGKVLIKHGSGATRFSSDCTRAAVFNLSTDEGSGPPRYTFSATDPVSTDLKRTYAVAQWNDSGCPGAPASTKVLTFYFAKASTYSDAALTTPKTAFAAGETAYVKVEGFKNAKNDVSTTWIRPSGAEARARASGAERDSRIPTPDPGLAGRRVRLLTGGLHTSAGDVSRRPFRVRRIPEPVDGGRRPAR